MIVERAIPLERKIKKRSKENISKIKQSRLRPITLKGAIEKSPMLLLQNLKDFERALKLFRILEAPLIFSWIVDRGGE